MNVNLLSSQRPAANTDHIPSSSHISPSTFSEAGYVPHSV